LFSDRLSWVASIWAIGKGSRLRLPDLSKAFYSRPRVREEKDKERKREREGGERERDSENMEKIVMEKKRKRGKSDNRPVCSRRMGD